MSQLSDLSKPFPASFIAANPSGYGNYVAHGLIKQRLLLHCGPYSFKVVEIVRGNVMPKKSGPVLENVVVGIIGRLTVEIDRRTVDVEEAGDCEDPANWPHDGARLKDACSDAIKRCAAHIGLGLHLWRKDTDPPYFLYDRLTAREEAAPDPTTKFPSETAAERRAREAMEAVAVSPQGDLDPGRPFTDEPEPKRDPVQMTGFL